jgi:hypothetical protein
VDLSPLSDVWIPVGLPGYAGAAKAARAARLDQRFGADGWRYGHYVRGRIVPPHVAIVEYEESYRRFLRDRPSLVQFLTSECGNVYDDNVTNVHDTSYDQPHTAMNHYQDISVRRVIAELVDDALWPDVVDTPDEVAALTDAGDGSVHHLPRARGFRGSLLWQVRGAQSPGFVLNPALVPVHDPALVVNAPNHTGWFLEEGCAHLSVEAFWQMSKVIEVRYDRFVALGDERDRPLDGV